MTSGALRRNLKGYGFIFPWLIALTVFIGMPFIMGFYFSFCDYPPLQSPVWVGLDNYKEMLSDPLWRQSMIVTLTYGAVAIPCGVLLAMTLAMFLNARIRGQTFYRVVFYIPFLVPTVVVAVLWMWIFNPDYGVLNIVLNGFMNQVDRWAAGLVSPISHWLGEVGWLFQSIAGTGAAASIDPLVRVRHIVGALAAVAVPTVAIVGFPLAFLMVFWNMGTSPTSRRNLKILTCLPLPVLGLFRLGLFLLSFIVNIPAGVFMALVCFLVGLQILMALALLTKDPSAYRPGLNKFLKFLASVGTVLAVVLILYALFGWLCPGDLKKLHSPGWTADPASMPSKIPFAPAWSLWALIVMSMWGVGQMAVIYLAKLQDVPAELYEAAEIDGASWLQKTWHVTIPQITPIIFFNMTMAIIGEFQVFAEPYIMTQGGPQDTTRFIAIFIYDQVFTYQRMGYGSAAAFILFLVIVALTVFAYKVLQKRIYYAAK
jgi:multiple sugar transport system permease protein